LDDAGVTVEGGAAIEVAATESSPEPVIGESRWPPALALLGFLILNVAVRVWLPGGSPVRVPWLVPAVEALLLVALVASDHTTVASRHWLRPVCVVLVLLLVAAALWATILLIHDLIKGSELTNSPSKLLASGALT
jgi:hypothetical protein